MHLRIKLPAPVVRLTVYKRPLALTPLMATGSSVFVRKASLGMVELVVITVLVSSRVHVQYGLICSY